jgi:hypothetical protein
MIAPAPSIFTIDVDGRPTVVFAASSWQEARELSREEWFRADLSFQMSTGSPLASRKSKFRPRFASPDESAKFERYRMTRDGQPDDLELVYLVPLDEGEGRELDVSSTE